MRPWARPVAWLKAHPFVADVLLAVVIAAVTLPNLWSDPTGDEAASYRDPHVAGALLLLVGTLPVAWRRRSPMAVLFIATVAVVAYEALGYPNEVGPFGALLALYTVAAHCDRRRSYQAAALALAANVIVFLTARWDVTLGGVVGNSVVFVTVWVIGDNLQTRRAYVDSLQERAELAERTRAEESRRAVAQERSRIARELHDVVAHSMSVMIVQAGAARRVVERDPAKATEAIAAIESTGRGAMTEMRRLLGVLRDDAGEKASLAPQPSIRQVQALVDQCADAGLDVRLELEGEERDLPPGVDLSAYRIVQEALTNTMKHAGPARAVVRVRYGEDDVEVEVRDDGRGASGNTDQSPGHGLLGMRERVELFGGELRAGPQPGGGFLVRARLPLHAGTRA